MSTNFHPTTPSTSGEPTWEVAQLMPRQGEWSEADYFELHTNKMAELVNGLLEVLPMLCGRGDRQWPLLQRFSS